MNGILVETKIITWLTTPEELRRIANDMEEKRKRAEWRGDIACIYSNESSSVSLHIRLDWTK